MGSQPSPTSGWATSTRMKIPKSLQFWGVLLRGGPLPTLAEGELLMMAVSTPRAWTAMASELPAVTYGDTGMGALLGHGNEGTRPTQDGAGLGGTCWSPSPFRVGTSSWPSPTSCELPR